MIDTKRIKVKSAGVSVKNVFVDGVKVATVWGHRGRDSSGIVANFGVSDLDGNKVAEGYCYYADAIKSLPYHLKQIGIK